MAFTVISNSFKAGDYLPNDFILSADFGFGCSGGNKSCKCTPNPKSQKPMKFRMDKIVRRVG